MFSRTNDDIKNRLLPIVCSRKNDRHLNSSFYLLFALEPKTTFEIIFLYFVCSRTKDGIISHCLPTHCLLLTNDILNCLPIYCCTPEPITTFALIFQPIICSRINDDIWNRLTTYCLLQHPGERHQNPRHWGESFLLRKPFFSWHDKNLIFKLKLFFYIIIYHDHSDRGRRDIKSVMWIRIHIYALNESWIMICESTSLPAWNHGMGSA